MTCAVAHTVQPMPNLTIFWVRNCFVCNSSVAKSTGGGTQTIDRWTNKLLKHFSVHIYSLIIHWSLQLHIPLALVICIALHTIMTMMNNSIIIILQQMHIWAAVCALNWQCAVHKRFSCAHYQKWFGRKYFPGTCEMHSYVRDSKRWAKKKIANKKEHQLFLAPHTPSSTH